jgi:hypothetical protein
MPEQNSNHKTGPADACSRGDLPTRKFNLAALKSPTLRLIFVSFRENPWFQGQK